MGRIALAAVLASNIGFAIDIDQAVSVAEELLGHAV